MGQLVWQGTGHQPLVCEKPASQFEVLCCDPAQARTTFNEVVVFLFSARFNNGFVSGLYTLAESSKMFF